MVIGLVIIGYVSWWPMVYASIDPSGRSYFNDQYLLSLEQFKNVLVEDNFEGCEKEDPPCAYWDREYDEPVIVRQDGVAELEINKQTKFSFWGLKPEWAECDLFAYEGELFSIGENSTRQLVSGSGWEGFQPQEGVYEADMYFSCMYQARNDSFTSHLFAWLKTNVAYAAPYGDYIGTIRFTVVDKNKPVPLTLPEKAAELAKQVIEADYLGDGETFGGKGWDPKRALYVGTAQIFEGYQYWNNKSKKVEFGSGIDCSGLIEWAYNYSFDPQKSLTKNVIRVESADGQYHKNSTSISESQLAKGDLLFLDKNNNDHIDHVAMYTGEFIDKGDKFDIIESFSPNAGVVPTTLEDYKTRPGFTNIIKNNLSPIRRTVLHPSIAGQVKVGSPVDISVTDPEGLIITPDTFTQTDEEYLREVSGELYYSERELGVDGRPKDNVYWFENKVGDYFIEVIPEGGTQLTDTYSLEFTVGDKTIKLAENVPISKIPEGGYFVSVGNIGEVESSGEVTSGYLLEKIKTHIQSFDIKESAKKPLLALANAIQKRLEINLKLQEKFMRIPALKKQLERAKENEKTILKKLVLEEKTFGQKEGKKLTNKEVSELIKVLTRVLLTFQD